MNKCAKCGEDTKNQKFCSSSCSASVNNVGKTRNGKRAKCKTCGNDILSWISRKTYCSEECKQIGAEEYKKQRDEKRKFPSQAAKKMAGIEARRNYLEFYSDCCVVCGYNKITEIHHLIELKTIKKHDINEFRKLNVLENLVCLCPNHHKELHRGMITQEFVNNKRALHML